MNIASIADATRKAAAPSPINSLREASEALSAAARSAASLACSPLASCVGVGHYGLEPRPQSPLVLSCHLNHGFLVDTEYSTDAGIYLLLHFLYAVADRVERGDLLSLIQSRQLSPSCGDAFCRQQAALAVLFGEWNWVSPQYPRCKQVDVEEESSAGIVQGGNCDGSAFECPAYFSVALDAPHRHRRHAAQDQQQQQAG